MVNLSKTMKRRRIEAELSSLENLVLSLSDHDVFSLPSILERKKDLISELNELEDGLSTDIFLQQAAVIDRAAEMAFRLVLEQRQESGSVTTITDLI